MTLTPPIASLRPGRLWSQIEEALPGRLPGGAAFSVGGIVFGRQVTATREGAAQGVIPDHMPGVGGQDRPSKFHSGGEGGEASDTEGDKAQSSRGVEGHALTPRTAVLCRGSTLTSAQVVDLIDAGVSHAQAIYASAWALKDADPIPQDYTADAHWP